MTPAQKAAETRRHKADNKAACKAFYDQYPFHAPIGWHDHTRAEKTSIPEYANLIKAVVDGQFAGQVLLVGHGSYDDNAETVRLYASHKDAFIHLALITGIRITDDSFESPDESVARYWEFTRWSKWTRPGQFQNSPRVIAESPEP